MSIAATAGKDASDQPRRWWQWLLVYPALAIAVVTALPTIVDKAGTLFTNVTRGKDQPAIASLGDAQAQSAMWLNNTACNTELHSWQDTSVGLRLDATICPLTGDVLVQALGSDHRQYTRWLSAKDQIVNGDRAASQIAALGSALIGVARASDLRAIPLVYRSKNQGGFALRRVQAQQRVLCTRQIDGRTLLRRIATPQGCFDIIIDTFTGQVTRQTAAPCIAQC